uniref:membrane-spanning 4-domains subfamily A member 15-like n=1 Tax=Solea senegalensis TaxID=28829 RepID=UPI001CD8DB06|nr:membrane-spanning 4-domains subfamily A member 15-like [Solea senegalensis]
MSSTVSTTVGDMCVVTHVNTEQQNSVGVRRFIKGQPQALGTVQIIIGVMVFLIGITMAPDGDTMGIHSGAFVWGSAFSITAGSLTVAAATKLNRCLIKCAMAFSIVTAVTSTIAAILYSVDFFVLLLFIRCGYDCELFKSRIEGISVVLVVFSLLQMIVSVVIAGYACCATCDGQEETPAVYLATGQTAAPNAKEASVMIPPPAYTTVVN